MNEVEEFDEFDGKVPVMDKRRFTERGEMKDEAAAAETKPEPSKPAAEIALEAKLVGVQAKFEEAKAGLEKETAEMRTRLMKTLDEKAKQGQFNFLTTLLPVLDNLNLAVASSETDPDITHLRDGVVGTARSFEKALLDVGVEAVPSVGEKFDPELHEAVDMAAVDADQDGLITAEYARGYRFDGKLLRPARVQVGKAMASTAPE